MRLFLAVTLFLSDCINTQKNISNKVTKLDFFLRKLKSYIQDELQIRITALLLL